MKKVFVIAVALFCCGYFCNAEISAKSAMSHETSQLQRTYYEGYAYAIDQRAGGYIPSAGASIHVRWTSEGLWINGEPSDLYVHQFNNGETLMMKKNGTVMYCSHYINIGGERYYFSCN